MRHGCQWPSTRGVCPQGVDRASQVAEPDIENQRSGKKVCDSLSRAFPPVVGGPDSTGRSEDAWRPGSLSPQRAGETSNRPVAHVILPHSLAWRVRRGDHPLGTLPCGFRSEKPACGPLPAPLARCISRRGIWMAPPCGGSDRREPFRWCRVVGRYASDARASPDRPRGATPPAFARLSDGGLWNAPFCQSACVGLAPPRRHLDRHWAAAPTRGCHHVGWTVRWAYTFRGS